MIISLFFCCLLQQAQIGVDSHNLENVISLSRLDTQRFGAMHNEELPSPALARRGRKPTLKTVAKATGLAVTTVSRALNDAPEIAKKTRERVHRVASELGYVPDRAALRLRTGRTNVISLVLAPHEEILGFGTSMIAGLTESLRGTQYHLVVMPYFDGEDPNRPILQVLRNRLADGIVFCRTQPQDTRVKLLLEHDFPFVSHGRTELATPHPYVDYDNFSFAHRAALRLIERGCDKVVLINAPSPYMFSHHMRHGFMAAVRETGVDHEIARELSIDSPPDPQRLFAESRLEPARKIGFVCGGEVSALSVMAAIADAGMRVGREAELVAKRTTAIFDQMRPQIDMIGEDLVAAGRKLGDLLLARLAGQRVETLQWLEAPIEMLRDVAPPEGPQADRARPD